MNLFQFKAEVCAYVYRERHTPKDDIKYKHPKAFLGREIFQSMLQAILTLGRPRTAENSS
jgi:aminopeptidase-like protein